MRLFFASLILITVCEACLAQDGRQVAGGEVTEATRLVSDNPMPEATEPFSVIAPSVVTLESIAHGDWFDLEVQNAIGDVDLDWKILDQEHLVRFDYGRNNIPDIYFAKSGTYNFEVIVKHDGEVEVLPLTVIVSDQQTFEVGGQVLDFGVPMPFTAHLKWRHNLEAPIATINSDADGYFEFDKLLGLTSDFSIELSDR